MKNFEIYIHFFWHQHQPWYPAPGSGMCSMPWTRLHAVKDYYDMAELCSRFEGWTQTINLVPSLIEQIMGYVDGSITDRYFELSKIAPANLSQDEKKEIIERFFDAHAPRMIHIFPRYDELLRKRDSHDSDVVEAFTDQDILDLQVWFNIAWIDPIWRSIRENGLQDLIDKQRDYNEDDKDSVLKLHLDILKQIIPVHKQMYEKGSLELTTTPYYHPILPLLCNSSIAKVSNPRDPIPEPPYQHPEDAEWHIEKGRDYFASQFEFQPQGVWPSEGSVSDDACALLAKAGYNYFATSQDILFRSTWADKNHTPLHPDLYRLHQLETKHGNLDCIFRDQHLSDLIGFHFSNQDAKSAAQQFIGSVKERTKGWNYNHPPIVNVVLDGENCWEFYPNDGHDFLRYLIEGILHDPQLHPTTVPKYREKYPTHAPTLTSIYPGSWIAHNFRIWIGHPEDNAAWHYLREAREKLTEKESSLQQDIRDETWKEIHICEGSDWYWWFGDENSSMHDPMFDEQFRLHLSRVYTLLDLPVPEELKRPIKRFIQDNYSGCIFLQPINLNGKQSSYYSWNSAELIEFNTSSGAMHQADNHSGTIKFGRYENTLFFNLQIDTVEDIPNSAIFSISITKPRVHTIDIDMSSLPHQKEKNHIIFSVDLEETGLELQQEIWLFITAQFDGEPPIAIPTAGELYAPAFSSANANPLWFS